jgi:hypothetical protein
MERSGLPYRKVVGLNPGWYNVLTYMSVRHVKPLISGKTIIKKFLIAKNTCFFCASNAGLLPFKSGAPSTGVYGFVTAHAKLWINQIFIYEIFWLFYPDNIFLVDLYHETLGPGVNVGSYPFPFGIKISLVSMRNPIFLSRSRSSFDSRCEPCIVFTKIVNVFGLQMKILRETHLFFSIV